MASVAGGGGGAEERRESVGIVAEGESPVKTNGGGERRRLRGGPAPAPGGAADRRDGPGPRGDCIPVPGAML